VIGEIVEGETTVKARHILVKALKSQCFHVEEEKIIPCTDNMGKTIEPPYKADIYASIQFIIELDPPESHQGDHRTVKDGWRNKNIYNQYGGLRTVRLQPSDVLKDAKLELTFKELLAQLKGYEQKN
jgi:hypothetical protein